MEAIHQNYWWIFLNKLDNTAFKNAVSHPESLHPYFIALLKHDTFFFFFSFILPKKLYLKKTIYGSEVCKTRIAYNFYSWFITKLEDRHLGTRKLEINHIGTRKLYGALEQPLDVCNNGTTVFYQESYFCNGQHWKSQNCEQHPSSLAVLYYSKC